MSDLVNMISRMVSEEIPWSNFNKSIKKIEIEQLLNQAYKVRKQNFKNLLKIYIPDRKFPAISVTGTSCELTCEHCDKKYLDGMKDIESAEDLEDFLREHSKRGGTGALISGGCDTEGSVPLKSYLDAIGNIKQETDLIINVHTGLPNENIIEDLIKSKIDIISIDVNLDEEVIRNIYHLDKNIADYVKAIDLINNPNLNVVPHICIGLNYGNVKKELDSLQYIKKNFEELGLIVFLILIPPQKSNFKTPKLEDVAKIIALSRIIFPKTEISLGCMRPRGKIKFEIEKLAIKAGVNRIEIPSKKTLDWLNLFDPEINFQLFSACCAIPPKFENKALSKEKDLRFYRKYL